MLSGAVIISRWVSAVLVDGVAAAGTRGRTAPAFARDEELLMHCEIPNPSHGA